MSTNILAKIQKDLEFIKSKLIVIDNEIEDISNDLHEVRPEYIKKIKTLDKRGKFSPFSSVDELRNEIEQEQNL
ncbi:peptidyl-prolyl cis-trans isomerase ppiD [Candidatus Kuenenia stuttgartiensis]|jgi:hypothetical protein|uniref:Peptidyl-prolyl cis-trans isomerase ppiD n=1 Tax=Kuenenia stuttgartiensis TaxID=174633 RepID=A0A2C9CH56_KUEST|nr:MULTISPECIES: DUF2683 family protein [Kuenenia]MBE7545838.1 hypothetical protein [Planctomycetia bacterium]MBW7943154.1 hypothetical protein [Candidatus Kuenenia stuttgartiensis]MBZ0191093.1 hypothetical protein [Candidatus Kuenenia stuttgartiensis]MCL4728645.1 hypothetical protein [Candidatus Kuenenia stuttgartiensis]MCZ7622857.1 hypothetical protein [Candidatus Kuenenia sp.]